MHHRHEVWCALRQGFASMSVQLKFSSRPPKEPLHAAALAFLLSHGPMETTALVPRGQEVHMSRKSTAIKVFCLISDVSPSLFYLCVLSMLFNLMVCSLSVGFGLWVKDRTPPTTGLQYPSCFTHSATFDAYVGIADKHSELFLLWNGILISI